MIIDYKDVMDKIIDRAANNNHIMTDRDKMRMEKFWEWDVVDSINCFDDQCRKRGLIPDNNKKGTLKE